jgi:hypothetical protein
MAATTAPDLDHLDDATKMTLAAHLDDVALKALRKKREARTDAAKHYWDEIKADARDEAARLRASVLDR